MTDYTEGNTSTEAMAGRHEPELLARLAELEAENARLKGNGAVESPAFGGEIPRYVLNGACFLEDDTYHHEGETIDYTGMPNLSMVPQNDAAKARMEEHIAILTEDARAAAEAAGRPFHGLFTDTGHAIAQARQDAVRRSREVTISMPEARDGPAPQMPHMPEAQAQQRRRGRPPKHNPVVAVQAAPLGPSKPTAEPVSVIGRKVS